MSDDVEQETQVALNMLGERLLQERKDRGWTLEALSERTGLSAGYISRIESGGRQPSLASLISIASAMETTISDLLGGSAHDRGVTKIEPGQIFGDAGFQYQRLSSPRHHQMSVLRLTISKYREAGEPHKHTGVEWVYALRGTLGVTVNNVRYCLRPGQAIQFEASLGHRFDCPEGLEAEALLVAVPEYSVSHVSPDFGEPLLS